ncbi:hypothetical protein GDO86_004458 [Hymenochirus boettgeri]|uniref:Zinc-finger domain-containing protein n=1 Tax=Hymenochirus boettgeri TaxID=247094 RepID=A0A8T2K8U8_9PIPI|nr:hypothetical protein GDO86_004458 [Hymenochirus boettgeri]
MPRRQDMGKDKVPSTGSQKGVRFSLRGIEKDSIVGSDSDEEQPNDFLEKRAKNIRDNQAMLARLMADLEKLPGNCLPEDEKQGNSAQVYRQKPPRASLGQQLLRRNPERSSNAQTRSMGYIHTIPHVVRPVEEITEDDLKNVADIGSTCHQCRQKTIDTRQIAAIQSDWRCPPCREICNCSFCRQEWILCHRDSLSLARYHGYIDVHSYLNRQNKDEESNDLIGFLRVIVFEAPRASCIAHS